MIVAVTGGTGAVGSRLVRRHLAQGDTVRVLSRQPRAAILGADICRGDLTDGTGLARFADGVHVLYHCAAESRDAARMPAINVEGTRRLARAARGKIGRWVQLGSVAVYGAPREGTIEEDTPAAPLTVYGETKAAADRVALEGAAAGGYGCTIVRPAKVFAAGLEGGNTAILRRLIAAIDAGLFFFIGRPGAMTHYVHVDNVVEALALCALAPAAADRAYNLSDDCSIEEFAAILADALGKSRPRLRLPEAPARLLATLLGWLPSFPLTTARVDALAARARFPCDRIARELGYRPPVPLAAGLRELVDDWKRSRRA